MPDEIQWFTFIWLKGRAIKTINTGPEKAVKALLKEGSPFFWEEKENESWKPWLYWKTKANICAAKPGMWRMFRRNIPVPRKECLNKSCSFLLLIFHELLRKIQFLPKSFIHCNTESNLSLYFLVFYEVAEFIVLRQQVNTMHCSFLYFLFTFCRYKKIIYSFIHKI